MSSGLPFNQKISQDGSTVYAASSAGSDAYAINLVPAITSYTAGQFVHFLADVANVGASTLNLNGLGAIAIKKNYNDDLDSNDIEAGQIVTCVYDGTNFQMQSQIGNSAVSNQSFELIDTATAASDATIDFTGFTSDYFAYKVFISALTPGTDNRALLARLATSGPTWAAGAGNYQYSYTTNPALSGDAMVICQNTLGTAANENAQLEVTIYNPSANNLTYIEWVGAYRDAGSAFLGESGAGAYVASTASVVGIRFLMAAGNIASGDFKLYGIKAS